MQGVTSKAGARKPQVRDVMFKVPGGIRGLGSQSEQEHILFRPVFSGTANVKTTSTDPEKPMTIKAVNDALRVCQRALQDSTIEFDSVSLRALLAFAHTPGFSNQPLSGISTSTKLQAHVPYLNWDAP